MNNITTATATDTSSKLPFRVVYPGGGTTSHKTLQLAEKAVKRAMMIRVKHPNWCSDPGRIYDISEYRIEKK